MWISEWMCMCVLWWSSRVYSCPGLMYTRDTTFIEIHAWCCYFPLSSFISKSSPGWAVMILKEIQTLSSFWSCQRGFCWFSSLISRNRLCAAMNTCSCNWWEIFKYRDKSILGQSNFNPLQIVFPAWIVFPVWIGWWLTDCSCTDLETDSQTPLTVCQLNRYNQAKDLRWSKLFISAIC